MNATGARRVRVNWTRIAVVAVVAYVGAGSASSALHFWRLYEQAKQLSAQLAIVRQHNQVLGRDLKELHNPAVLRQMLTGQRPLPNAIWPRQ